ncbi:hypothetical protein ACSFCM_18655 [Enterococcus gilvus]
MLEETSTKLLLGKFLPSAGILLSNRSCFSLILSISERLLGIVNVPNSFVIVDGMEEELSFPFTVSLLSLLVVVLSVFTSDLSSDSADEPLEGLFSLGNLELEVRGVVLLETNSLFEETWAPLNTFAET